MTLPRNTIVLQCAALTALALAGSAAAAADLAGRGVHYFASSSGCPLPRVSAGPGMCNRIGLDDDATTAAIDPGTQQIHFNNTRSYAKKTIVGDVLLQGSAVSASGQRVPVSAHLLISKSGDKWSLSSHEHAPVRGAFHDVQIDPYSVDVPAPGGRRVLASSNEAVKVVADPTLAVRLATQLVQVRDNREAPKGGAAGMATGDPDITIALGSGRVAKPVMRARLHSDPLGTGDLATLLAQGTWWFELEALTGKIPDRVVQRELFLYGLSEQALLKPLMAHGFASRDKLVVGAVNGKGYLRYRDQQQPFDGAGDVATTFLQQSFIGLVLGTQLAYGNAPAR